MRSIEQSFEAPVMRRPGPAQCRAADRDVRRRPAPTAPVRLTHRGRAFVVLLVLAVLVTAGVTVGRASSRAAGPSRPLPTVTVHPGETLWQIAARVAPHTDRRLLVAEIEDMNGLSDGRVVAGQQLRLPR